MKKITILSLLVCSLFAVKAQELPKPSPMSTVTQKVGLNTLKVEYSRPSAKGRVIFGELVPFDKVWRFGANSPTKFTTDKVVRFGKQTLEPGTYAVFALPSKDMWKIVFNTNIEQWGAGDYDEKKDVVSLDVKPEMTAHTETFSVTFNELKSNEGTMVISWEKTQLKVPFTVDTHKAAVDNIETAIAKGEDLEKVYANAASYFNDSQNDKKTAMKYVDKSIGVKSYYGNLWLKAKMLYDSGDKKNAIQNAEKALVSAQQAEAKGYVTYIQKKLVEWSK